MATASDIERYFKKHIVKIIVAVLLSIYLAGSKTPDLVYNIINFTLGPFTWALKQLSIDTTLFPKTYYIFTTIYFFYFIRALELLFVKPIEYSEKAEQIVDEYRIKYQKDEPPQQSQSSIYKFPTSSGIFVRSIGEQQIADFLTRHNINFRYDTPIALVRRAGLGHKTFRPDFFLPDQNIILEFWASYGEVDYDKDMDRKKQFYVDAKMPFVSVEEFDLVNIEKTLSEKLKRII